MDRDHPAIDRYSGSGQSVREGGRDRSHEESRGAPPQIWSSSSTRDDEPPHGSGAHHSAPDDTPLPYQTLGSHHQEAPRSDPRWNHPSYSFDAHSRDHYHPRQSYPPASQLSYTEHTRADSEHAHYGSSRMNSSSPNFMPSSYMEPHGPHYYTRAASYPPYYPPPHAPGPTPYQAPVEYIYSIKPTDVLCGRGGATNSHSGNRSFREMVDKHREQYLKAKKRDKPAVASFVVDLVRERGGRFLRKVEQSYIGGTAWYDIGDTKAIEKTCQALRENAPERRRKMVEPAPDVKEPATTVVTTIKRDASQDTATRSSVGSLSPHDSKEDDAGDKDEKDIDSDSDEGRDDDGEHEDDRVTIIRPALSLTRRRFHPVKLEDLPPHLQELYRIEFEPPDPRIRKRRGDRREDDDEKRQKGES